MLYIVLICVAVILYFVGYAAGMNAEEKYNQTSIESINKKLTSAEESVHSLKVELNKTEEKLKKLTTLYDQYANAYYEIDKEETV